MSETTAETASPAYEGWAIVELMGRRQTAGLIKEVDMAGCRVLRIDTPAPDSDEILATQFYGGAAIYCVTPCQEEIGRKLIAERSYSMPAAVRLAIPKPAGQQAALGYDGEFDDDDLPI